MEVENYTVNSSRYFCILWFTLSNKKKHFILLGGSSFNYPLYYLLWTFGTICHRLTVTSVAEITSREKPMGQASVAVEL